MKTLMVLAVAVAGTFTGATAMAQDYHRDYRVGYYSRDRHDGGLERNVNHLDRMRDQVRAEARRYRADWNTRREVQNISREVDRVMRRYRSGDYDRSRLRRDVDRLHDRLHAIEQRLRVRPHDYYRWD